ncbi:MAG TPA: S8 family peptidase [Herpetosiphonaceae bacterium]
MKRFVGLLASGLVLSASVLVSGPAAAAPAQVIAANGKAIPDQYIVVLKEGAQARSVASVAGISPKYVYEAALNGFAAQLNAGQLKALQNNPNVAYIEQDAEATISTTQTGATWGLDRIDQRNLPLSGTYTYNTTASNVTAYVIDTGIYTAHGDFGGRAVNVYDALGGNGQDCNGHGTHVAGTIGGATWGVAKGVQLRGVRVLDCGGSGTWAGVIAGMDYVANNAVKPAVANMSLGGGANTSVDNAATNMVNRGITVAVAAGNSNANACNYSPARAASVLTVAASTRTDAKASYSNHGSCVELYAPGDQITSAWNNGGTSTISGTSMASPHVAGVAALYLAGNPTAAPATVNSWIINNATANVITGNPAGTPNRLLYVPAAGASHAGMTWTVLQQRSDGVVHVGSDSQTNPYSGDTPATASLPVLCLNVTYSSVPAGITPDFYNGWARGSLAVTPAVSGTQLTSRAAADAICAANFGSSWRMAEFHDGWYGANLEYSGGWSYWGYGTLAVGSRFWVAINDQPANPWN